MTTAGRRLAPALGIGLLALLVGAGTGVRTRAVPSPVIGEPAPPFSLPRLDDPARTLSVAELEGEVWLLNVWASWCAVCRSEHALLASLAAQQQVPIYGLNYADDRRDAQEWLLRFGDPYAATVSDARGHASSGYGAQGVPETYLIDAGGIVRFRHVGALTAEVLQRDLLPLIRRLKP